MKRFIVTGTTGFVGSYVVSELKRHGEVFPLRHGAYDSAGIPNTVDAVIHVGALTQKTKLDTTSLEYYREQNVSGTSKALVALEHIAVGQLIYVSTLDVYGQTTNQLLDEAVPPHPQSAYGKSKLEAEHVCETWAQKRNISCCIARLGLVYGPGEGAYEKVIPTYIRRALDKKPLIVFGSGAARRDFIHVSDVARCIQLFIQKKVSGIYNIASGTSYAILDVAGTINELTHNGGGILLTPGQNTEGDVCFDVSKIMKLGFTPEISFASGIAQEIAWFQAHV